MKITKRDITSEELKMIHDDFRAIEVKYGVALDKKERFNITIDDDDGNIIGIATGLSHRDVAFFLSDLWVRADLRGTGLGSKILRMLEDDIKKIGIKYIYTWTSSFDKNDEFYKKQGYSEIMRHENYYNDIGDSIYLHKELN